VTNARVAILSRAHNGRAACHFCGPCERGCATFSYFNSVHVTLPAARATGRFTLRPFSVVHSVMFDAQTRRALGVRVIDANTRQVIEYRARVVFLCASTLESARILLNSATPEFPDGLANSSGMVGRNLMDHIMGGGANGVMPWLADRKTVGNARSGFYVPRFRNVSWALLDKGELETAESHLQDAEQWLDTENNLPVPLPPGMIFADEEQLQMLPATIASARTNLALAHGDMPSTVK
jgi:choline dehydrogenase-like flavoprotein